MLLWCKRNLPWIMEKNSMPKPTMLYSLCSFLSREWTEHYGCEYSQLLVPYDGQSWHCTHCIICSILPVLEAFQTIHKTCAGDWWYNAQYASKSGTYMLLWEWHQGGIFHLQYWFPCEATPQIRIPCMKSWYFWGFK
jgi:hypothetical protein